MRVTAAGFEVEHVEHGDLQRGVGGAALLVERAEVARGRAVRRRVDLVVVFAVGETVLGKKVVSKEAVVRLVLPGGLRAPFHEK